MVTAAIAPGVAVRGGAGACGKSPEAKCNCRVIARAGSDRMWVGWNDLRTGEIAPQRMPSMDAPEAFDRAIGAPVSVSCTSNVVSHDGSSGGHNGVTTGSQRGHNGVTTGLTW
eukprot:9467937-Pyramimonas_sp.AAC.1